MSETMADFEKELEASFRKLNEGDVVEGVITGVDENAVYLDINYHAQGIVKKEDYSDDPSFSLQSVPVGDTVKAVVLSDDDGEGNVSLSVKEASKAMAWETVKKYMEELNMNPKNMERSLNVGFSGGEKKKNEILQMLVLNPKLAILDETDSGLDVDAIKTVSKGIKMFKNDNNAVLIMF